MLRMQKHDTLRITGVVSALCYAPSKVKSPVITNACK